MDAAERQKKRAEDRRKWKASHPEQVKEQRRRYRAKHRSDIALYNRNHRRLKKMELETSSELRGTIQLTGVQVDVLIKLFPGVMITEAVRILIGAEVNRRMRS